MSKNYNNTSQVFHTNLTEDMLLEKLQFELSNGNTLKQAVSVVFNDNFIPQNFRNLSSEYTYKGVTGSLAHLCREFNISYSKVRGRLVAGHSIEVAMTKKRLPHRLKGEGKRITFREVTGNLSYLCEHFGFNYKTVHYYINKKGYSAKDALEVMSIKKEADEKIKSFLN